MAEFTPAVTATVKMNVGMNESGFVAQDGETVKSTKAISIPGIKAAATLAEANAVYTAFLGNIAGGSFDSLTAKKTITQGVTE